MGSRPVRMLVATTVWLLACGGTVDIDSTSGTGGQSGQGTGGGVTFDASKDQNTPPDVVAVDVASEPSYPDVSPTDTSEPFCSGDTPKLLYNGATIHPEAVTSSLVFMDCCDGATILLHTAGQLTNDMRLFLRFPGMFQTGDYQVDPDNMLVGLSASPGTDQIPTSGTMHAQVDGGQSVHFTMCIEAVGGTSPLSGTRIYLPAAGLANYGWSTRWGIHLLTDKNLSAVDAAQLPIESLPVADFAILDLNSVDYYEQTTHRVFLTEQSSAQSILSQLDQPIPIDGVPFVVQADGQRIYLGAFWTVVSSLAPSMPSISVETSQANYLQIDPPMGSPDPRSDPRMLQTLTETWKLAP